MAEHYNYLTAKNIMTTQLISKKFKNRHSNDSAASKRLGLIHKHNKLCRKRSWLNAIDTNNYHNNDSCIMTYCKVHKKLSKRDTKGKKSSKYDLLYYDDNNNESEQTTYQKFDMEPYALIDILHKKKRKYKKNQIRVYANNYNLTNLNDFYDNYHTFDIFNSDIDTKEDRNCVNDVNDNNTDINYKPKDLNDQIHCEFELFLTNDNKGINHF